MNIREINKPVTAKSLNESLAKRFGQKIALEKFTTEQLQDVRNKVRTTLSQVETNESFNTTQSEAYQKNKLFLDVLNAEIAERADIVEAGKPDFLDLDKDGNKKEPMKKAAKDKEKKKDKPYEKQIGMGDSRSEKELRDQISGLSDATLKKWASKPAGMLGSKVAKLQDKLVTAEMKKRGLKESIVREGAEDQAELVMAAKNMVERVTSWMEDTAEMQTESMLELADAIRDEKGQQESDSYVDTVKPALESLYAAMETTRQALTQGVGLLTGEATPETDMGAEPEGEEPEMEPTVDAEGGDEFGAGEAAVGGEEEAGREKRESKQLRGKKLAEQSRKLGTILSKKK
jgi:hypothetical protein